MSSAKDVIHMLRSHGVQLTVVGHQLEVNAPQDVLDDEIRSSITKYKLDIIDQILRDSEIDTAPFPISNIQKRMTLTAASSRHQDHVRSIHRFVGDIQRDTMSAAVQVLIQRNPTLLLRFVESNGEVMQQMKATGIFNVDEIELAEGENSEDAAMRYVKIPFDMSNDLLIRVGITSEDESGTRHLISVIHHALADGHSNALITNMLSDIYNQIHAGVMPAIADSRQALESYRAYCIASTSPSQDTIKRESDRLGADLEGAFPACDESNETKRNIEYRLRNITFPEDLRISMKSFPSEHSITLLSASIAAAQVLLMKTHQDETGAIGCPISNRFTDSTINIISNMTMEIPMIQTMNDSDPIIALMKKAQQDILGRIDEPYCPLESLIEEGLLNGRGNRRLRLPFSVGLYEFKSGLKLTTTKTTREFDSHENPFLGMALRILHDEDLMELEYEYDRGMVSDERADELAAAYLEILRIACEDPTRSIGQIQLSPAIAQGNRLTTYRNSNTSGNDVRKIDYENPLSMLESILATHWLKVLKIGHVARTDRFFELGGSSLQVIQLIDSVGDALGRPISLTDLIGDPTLAELTKILLKDSNALTVPPTMQIVPEARGLKCFCIPGQGGISTFTFGSIARKMQSKAKLIGLQVPGIDPDSEQFDSIEEIALHMADEIDQEREPGHPVMIMGHSAGGIIAMEIIKILESRAVPCLAPILIGTSAPVKNATKSIKEKIQTLHRRRKMLKGSKRHSKSLNLMSSGSKHGNIESRVKVSVDRMSMITSRFNPSQQYCSNIILINDNGTRFCSVKENTRRWSELTSGNVSMTFVDCAHLELVTMGEEKIQFHMEELIASAVSG